MTKREKTRKVRTNRHMRRALGLGESGSVSGYFFKGGDPRHPRDELVRRDELWAVLDWYDSHARRANNPIRILWRILARFPVAVIRPFQLWRVYAGDKQQEGRDA